VGLVKCVHLLPSTTPTTIPFLSLPAERKDELIVLSLGRRPKLKAALEIPISSSNNSPEETLLEPSQTAKAGASPSSLLV